MSCLWRITPRRVASLSATIRIHASNTNVSAQSLNLGSNSPGIFSLRGSARLLSSMRAVDPVEVKEEDVFERLHRALPARFSSSSGGSSTGDDGTSPSLPPGRFDHLAVADLFAQYAQIRDGISCLNFDDIRALRAGIGEDPTDDQAIEHLFSVADLNGDGFIDLQEFIEHADSFVGSNPARIIIMVGGPGSGKGSLCRRLEEECNVVHLSSGDLLREEVALQTSLGKHVQSIMAQGGLVSSAMIVAMVKKRMRRHPGKRLVLDGFPRSRENAEDLVTLCGIPEVALHLVCDDTVMIERIMRRGADSEETGGVRRVDDNLQTGLERIRTYHKYHNSTLEWLEESNVPIVQLDCSGTPESVWQQLLAIGKLMRPAVKVPVSNGVSDVSAPF